jgi:hypothetical protein
VQLDPKFSANLLTAPRFLSATKIPVEFVFVDYYRLSNGDYCCRVYSSIPGYTSHRPWSWGVVFDCVRREKSVNSVAKVKCKMGKQVMAVNRSVAAVMATV